MSGNLFDELDKIFGSSVYAKNGVDGLRDIEKYKKSQVKILKEKNVLIKHEIYNIFIIRNQKIHQKTRKMDYSNIIFNVFFSVMSTL